jgi:hypothetical protein
VQFFDHDELPPEVRDRLRDLVPQFELDAGRLQRVIPIGQVVEASEVRVELIAMEVREAGAYVYWKAVSTEERLLGAIQAEVSDDRGTVYTTHTGEYGGGGSVWKGQFIVKPAPPLETRSLRIAISGFAEFATTPFPPTLQAPVKGVWDFEFEDNQDAR